jgi:hypothetical protein
MTPLILHTREDGQAQVRREATDKESLSVEIQGAPVASNHFRGITKMFGPGSGSPREVDHVRGFPTRRVENPW